ncbi:outer membrane protein [Dokdonia sp. MED134]|uniref:RagB/SusD family nutrient uptake outer membrane protein n=1 Tax=Dokdonia sp. MED134 TaxID=313590 RepID=UPI000068BFB9|nr:RagB/SusD family nutrient uptake outer membrane protein [Dokdonia sp. MED134]EAQ38183.1 outer membrane protein [Dokdonia sp. MED134]
MKHNKNLSKMIRNIAGIFAVAALAVGCTDLEIEGNEAGIVTDASFAGVTDPDSFIDNMYGSLNGYIGDQANLFALSEVTTDAALIPTRGADWGDNGIWRQLHQHNWLTTHTFILNTFVQWNSLHFQSAQVLSSLTNSSTQNKADAYFLRALGMWVILDNFGQIPVRDPEENLSVNPVVLTGAEAVDQIVSDLNAAITDLPAGGPGSGNSRATKAAARYLLAKVLLNKHIYLGNETADSADMNQVVSLVDQIQAEAYGLEDGYFDIFREELDDETIWFIPTGVGNRIWNGLHYNMSPEIAGGGWNGFSTLASYYDLFEGDPNNNEPGNGQEERRGFVPTSGLTLAEFPEGTDSNDNGIADGTSIGFGFLIGQQYADDGTPLQDRAGNALFFTRDFTDADGNISLINNNEVTGIRVQKYAARYGGFTPHEIFFRYSDAHMMKAEAIFRSGGDATPLVNELRLLRGATALGSVTAQDIIDERGREFYAEFWRRNDLIRFGQFTSDWQLKDPAAVGNTDKNLFPIPASQLILNPNLTQNPGY